METKKMSEDLKLHKDMVIVWGDSDYGFGFDGMVEKSICGWHWPLSFGVKAW